MKIGLGFLEEHAEKIILVIVGLICVWLLITRVLISPNVVEHEGRKFGPAAVDSYVKQQAMALEASLKSDPKSKPPYDPCLPEFVAKLDSAISGVDTSVAIALPYNTSAELAIARRDYDMPRIGEVADVAAGHIRAVVYEPVELVTEKNPYDKARCEPNDIDLVTVEAKFDVAALYDNFHRNYAGSNIKEEWRDPCLAKPVFAAVDLQRQESKEDGTWGEWQSVPRARVESRREMFDSINSLPPGGVKVRMLQFDDRQVVIALLQPQTYQIASADEEWFPPSLYEKYADIRDRERLEQRRKELEDKKEEMERKREEDLQERRGGGYGGQAGGAYGGYDRYGRNEGRSGLRGGRTGLSGSRYGSGQRPSDRLRSPRRGVRGETGYDRSRSSRTSELAQKPSVSDVYYELDEMRITPMTKLSKLEDLLVFWAHDDTVQPQKTYRYRIRLGVFNPVAGSDGGAETILWSEFSETTESVKIPGGIYFFANSVQEAEKMVTVEVAKYVLGYWYSQDFAVRRGEVIGTVAKVEQPKEERLRPDRISLSMTESVLSGRSIRRRSEVPEEVDYSTGAVMVDVVSVNDWTVGSNPRARQYHDMLYSYDGTTIGHMPVRSVAWGEDLQTAYAAIKRAQREPRKSFRAFNSTVSGARRDRRPTTPTRLLPDGYEGLRGDELEQLQRRGRF